MLQTSASFFRLPVIAECKPDSPELGRMGEEHPTYVSTVTEPLKAPAAKRSNQDALRSNAR